jgi:hypothetical protein
MNAIFKDPNLTYTDWVAQYQQHIWSNPQWPQTVAGQASLDLHKDYYQQYLKQAPK